MTTDATSRRHDVLRAALTLDEQLDDIKRAQIWSQLEDRLAEPAHARRSWRLPVAALAAAAALALVWLHWGPGHPAARTLSAPAETTLAASIGPHTRAELVGPAQLELIGPVGDATRVHLTRGTLLAEFTGGPGRSLRIETREAVVEIVGTLFSVEARADATCVSVAHGKVRVTTHSGTLAVSGGESWCSTNMDVSPIEPAAHDHLDRFEAVITARDSAPTPLKVAVASPPMPPDVVVTAPTPPVVAPTPSAPPVSAAPSQVVVAAAPAHRDAPTAHRDEPHVATPTRSAPPGSPPRVELATTLPPPSPASEPAHAPTPTAPPPIASPSATSDPIAAPPSAPVAAPPTPPSPVVAPPAPAVAAPPTPESLYEAAETALAKRDAAGADRILARLLTDFPHASLADQALLERARIAYDRHAWRDAQQDLDQLAAIASTPLAEPGAYLACRIAIAAHDGAAEHCLSEFRKAYPKSAHDLDVLGVLTDLAYQAGGCRRARSRIDELVRAYSHTTLAHAWVGRCPEDQ